MNLIFLKSTKKHCFFVLLFFVIIQLCNAQTNLVKNGGFEQYTTCPDSSNLSAFPNFWYPNTNSGAYYSNACSMSICNSVPYNCCKGYCYQQSHSGNGYVFLDYVNGGIGNDGRSYVQTQMKDSLSAGHRYYAEFFVNLPNTMRFACNNNGLLFTNNAVYVDTINYPYGVLPANPQIMSYGNPIVTDTFGWVKISGIYKALGGERYVTLGNFKHDSNTIVKDVNPTGYYGTGYFIEDISVIPLDSMPLKADAGRDTTITTGDSAFIGTYTNGIDSIKWQILNSNNTIDSIRPGFWVHPTVNTCYVVTQTVNGYTSSDTVCVTVSTVPLKMLSYELRMMNEKAVENIWTTANEINVSHFYIQRSINGKDFTIIGKEKAENKTLNNYSYIDELTTHYSLPTTLYYRIASVDIDEKTSYSDIKSINYKPQTTNSVSIFPNPSTDFVTVECKDAKEVSIVDCLGRVVYQSTIDRQPSTIINMKNFNKGLYVVKVLKNNGVIEIAKFIKE